MVTVKNQYSLPQIDKMLDQFHGCTYFTVMDQKEAFHQIWIKEEEEHKTTFKMPYSMYKYIVMPFRLTGALAMQQALANDMLKKGLYKFVVVYLNNILIYTKGSFQDHIKKVK